MQIGVSMVKHAWSNLIRHIALSGESLVQSDGIIIELQCNSLMDTTSCNSRSAPWQCSIKGQTVVYCFTDAQGLCVWPGMGCMNVGPGLPSNRSGLMAGKKDGYLSMLACKGGGLIYKIVMHTYMFYEASHAQHVHYYSTCNQWANPLGYTATEAYQQEPPRGEGPPVISRLPTQLDYDHKSSSSNLSFLYSSS